MKTLLLACLLGIVAFVSGLIVFGQIDGEKIIFERSTLEKIDSFDEVWALARTQPLAVYVCGGVGFLVGFLANLVLWRSRRRKKQPAVAARDDLSKQRVVPERPAKKTKDSELGRLEAERPFLCKILGFLTLGICKFYAIPQGNALVVMAFGKYRKACEPGLGCILSLWGFYQRPYKNMPLIQRKENTDPYNNEIVFTSDGVRCKLDVLICYRVVDPGKALFEVDNYKTAIHNIVRAVLRNEYAKQPSQTLLSSRKQIAGNLQSALEKDVIPWGIKVRLVEITYVDIPAQDMDDKLDHVSSE